MIVSLEQDFPAPLTVTITPFFQIPLTVYTFLLHLTMFLHYSLCTCFIHTLSMIDIPTFLFSYHKHYLGDLIYSDSFNCHQYITDSLSF